MSTPTDNPGNYDQFPSGPSAEDLAAKNRVVDVANTIDQMNQGTEALLQTLSSNLASLRATVETFPAVFASTAEHIKRGADYQEKLAKNTERAAKANKESEKSLKNQKFSVIDTVKALARGDIQGAIGEGFQGIGPYGGPGGRLAQRAGQRYAQLGEGSFWEKLTGRGVVERGPWGIPTTASQAGVSRLGGAGMLARAGGLILAGELLTPAAIFGAYKLAQRGIHDYQQARRIGALTGEGAGAGFAATGVNIPLLGNVGGEVFNLRGSPFDLVGNKEALEIVQGVRGAGFRGGQARGIEETVRGIVNDVGVSVQDAMSIAIPAIKEANFSTGQLSETMKSLRQTAHDSTISINDLTKSVGSLIQERAQTTRYGAQLAPAQLQTLADEFRGTKLGQNAAALQSILSPQSILGIAQQSGVSPLDITSRDFIDNFITYYNKLILRLAMGNDAGNGGTRWSWDMYVARILTNPQLQQTFGGMTPSMLADALRTAWKQSSQGKNPAQFLDKQVQLNRVESAKTNVAGGIRNLSNQFDYWQDKNNWANNNPVTSKIARDLNLLGQTDQQIRSLNLGYKTRMELETPLRKAIQSGRQRDIHGALKELGDRIVQATKDSKSNVNITVDPRHGRHIRATTNAQANAAGRGEASQQGTSYLYP